MDACTTAVHDATNSPSVISISWGGPESTWTAQAMANIEGAYAAGASLGVTVCCASGDDGSADTVGDGRQHVLFPASATHALACGGTTLRARGPTISSEVVWNAPNGATGGGVSNVFPVPPYQAGANVPPSANPGGLVAVECPTWPRMPIRRRDTRFASTVRLRSSEARVQRRRCGRRCSR